MMTVVIRVMIRMMVCSMPVVAVAIMAPMRPGQTLPLMVKMRRFVCGHLIMPVACEPRLPGFGFFRMAGM